MKSFLITILTLSVCSITFAQVKSATISSAPVMNTKSIIAFKANATYVGGEPVANNTDHKVYFGGTLFNEGNAFSKEQEQFLVPEDGYYHFDLRVSWLKFSAPGSVELYILTNWYNTVPAVSIQQGSTTQATFDSNFGALIKMKKGDKVTVQLKQKSGVVQQYQQVQFSGFKIN